MSHLGHRKPARIHWKANAFKTSHCLVRILVQRHNWAIFLRIWTRRSRYRQCNDRYRALLNEFLFTKIKEDDIGNIWFQQDGATCHTAVATPDVLHPVSEDRIISRRADVVWPPRTCDLTPLDYYLCGAAKDKCYADKPDTIEALKDNIREAIWRTLYKFLWYILSNSKKKNRRALQNTTNLFICQKQTDNSKWLILSTDMCASITEKSLKIIKFENKNKGYFLITPRICVCMYWTRDFSFSK